MPLKTCVSQETTAGPPYFRSSPEMPQIPGALPFFSLPRARRTSASVGSSQSMLVSVTAALAACMRSPGGFIYGRSAKQIRVVFLPACELGLLVTQQLAGCIQNIYATAKINGKSIRCLLDSGCERSIIAWSLVCNFFILSDAKA